jgi:hypothetical protein
MTTNVKLLNINGMGPVLAVMQAHNDEQIIVTNPAILGTDPETHDLAINDYLGGISDLDSEVVFMKYNIISISTPEAGLAQAYIAALEAAAEPKSQIFVPDNKIVVAK